MLKLLLLLASLLSAVPAIADAGGAPLGDIFADLEAASARTERQPLAASLHAPVDIRSLTRMRRYNSSGRISDSNATIIAANSCQWLVATAGHSVLDHRYDRLVAPALLRVLTPGGHWAVPEEIIPAPELSWRSTERGDWALLVLRDPNCSFADDNRGGAPLPHLPTSTVNPAQLDQCHNSVQLLCYHFDRNGQRMIERGCALRTFSHGGELGDDSTGYFSCKQDAGASGCAVLCDQGERWLNLGIFSKGLQRHGEIDHPQRVGAFRVVDGELARTIARLKEKYGME